MSIGTEYINKALDDFSGYIAAGELYDDPFCVLFIVDNHRFRRLCYEVPDHDPTHEDINRFFKRFKGMLKACELTLKGITTDGSPLYPDPIARVFGKVKHQICTFHILQEITKAIIKAVAKVRKELKGRKIKRSRGRPSGKSIAGLIRPAKHGAWPELSYPDERLKNRRCSRRNIHVSYVSVEEYVRIKSEEDLKKLNESIAAWSELGRISPDIVRDFYSPGLPRLDQIYTEVGLEAFSYYMVDCPEIIHRQIAYNFEKVVQALEAAVFPVEALVVSESCDIAFKSNLLFPPDFLRKSFITGYSRFCDAVHKQGRKVLNEAPLRNYLALHESALDYRY